MIGSIGTGATTARQIGDAPQRDRERTTPPPTAVAEKQEPAPTRHSTRGTVLDTYA